MENFIVEKGKCICIYEPRGDNGLEGFIRNDVYNYEKVIIDRKVYYKIYLDANSLEDYGICGRIVFKRFFNIEENYKKEL